MTDPKDLGNLNPKNPKKKTQEELMREIEFQMGIPSDESREEDDEDDVYLGEHYRPQKYPSDTLGRLDFFSEYWALRYNLDKEKVKAVYHRCYEIGWYVDFFDPPSTGLDFAFREIEPQKALEIFENTDDLEKLRSSEYTFRYLTELMLEPYCTLPELAGITRKFIEFQKRHKEHIVQTGFPKRIFQPPGSFDKNMFWFDWHLSRLYYVKAPVNSQDVYLNNDAQDVFYRVNPQLWKGDATEYNTIWAKGFVEVKKTGQTQIEILRKPTVDFIWRCCNLEDGIFINSDGEPVGLDCPYKGAPCFDFLTEDMTFQLEGLREKVFDVRMEIISRLHKALKLDSANGLWDECLEILACLNFDEVQFLLRSDRLFMNEIHQTQHGHPYKSLVMIIEMRDSVIFFMQSHTLRKN